MTVQNTIQHPAGDTPQHKGVFAALSGLLNPTTILLVLSALFAGWLVSSPRR